MSLTKSTPQNHHLNFFKQDHQLDHRKFLEKFKTIECKIGHNYSVDCEFYHNYQDKRRSPYIKYMILYTPEICHEYNCNYINCKKCHNIFEYQFHPLVYKSIECNKYHNCQKKYCSYLHMGEINTIKNYFFRFDLNTFKTILCTFTHQHNLKTCQFYHNKLLDRRRPNFNYQHGSCQLRENCLSGDECRYSHNKIQQLYHPSRYKSKFCQKYPNKIDQCQYKQFCSFAHQDSEIVINLIHLKKKDDRFYIGEYKTVWCPYTNKHERNKCVYAHNIQDFRRNPKFYDYQPLVCPNWNMTQNLTSLQMGGCPKGMNCNNCHGWKQLQNHPLYYKTKSKKQKLYQIDHNYQKNQIIKIFQTKNNIIKRQFVQLKQKIQPIILDPSMIGAPFFQSDSIYSKQEREISSNKQYKLRGTSSQTDANQIKSSNRKQSVDSYMSKGNSQDRKQIFPSKLFEYREDQLFSKQLVKHTQQINRIQKRAKSCNKTQQSLMIYSKQLKQNFIGTKLLEKLEQNKVSEIKITNMSEYELQKMNYFTQEQKILFRKKIKQYNDRSQVSSKSYSSQLKEFFATNNKHYLLNKMKNKRVREQKLLSMQPDQILSLSFLEQQQKQVLPKILKEFNNNREYSDIASMISEQTKISITQSLNDNS